MALFAISFRIGMEGNSGERRDSLLDQAKANASGIIWEDTSSFLLFNCDRNVEELASDIHVNSKMDLRYDRLLVVNLSLKRYAAKGELTDPITLSSLMNSR